MKAKRIFVNNIQKAWIFPFYARHNANNLYDKFSYYIKIKTYYAHQKGIKYPKNNGKIQEK